MSRPEQSVIAVFAARCRELAVGSKGAALAVTLAFIAPVYLMVIGVYGIGEIVRSKIELQNAADAAAYSASVVQADYLSRMATVNKAMAWTYVDLQKRSLDLAMHAFTDFVLVKFQEDLATAKEKNSPCHMHAIGVNYNCGYDVLVVDAILKIAGSGLGIPEVAKKFNNQGLSARVIPLLLIWALDADVRGKGWVNEGKVMEYSNNIIKMMDKLNKLRKEYPGKVKKTAQEVAIANMAECKDDYMVNVTMGSASQSFLTVLGTEEEEMDFIAMADPTLNDFHPKAVFGTGTDAWIVRKDHIPGFWRLYNQTSTHLYAKWDWFWTAWRHINLPWPLPDLHLPPLTGSRIGHKHPEYHGYDITLPLIRKNLPIGLLVPPAIPIVLTRLYFGKSGSITVAIARKTCNPLSLFSGQGVRSLTASGMMSAFNPSVAGGYRPEYMCAIASARAGYKRYQSNKKEKLASSDYLLGYTKMSREQTWNLAETDWDGMLLPVRNAWDLCAGTQAAQVFTVSTGGNILSSVMLDKSNWVDKDGKTVSSDRLPDWENLRPPAGLVRDGASSGQKLNWSNLRKYLGH